MKTKEQVVEDRYTKVPNVLFEAIPRLKPSEGLVMFIVCRETFGWNRPSRKLSIGYLMKATGLAKNTVLDAVAALENKLLMKRERSGDSYEYRLIVVETGEGVQNLNPPGVQNLNPTKTVLKDSTKDRGAASADASSAESSYGKFIRLWFEAHEETFGERYIMLNGRDGKRLKELLDASRMSPETLLGMVRQAWEMKDRFLRGRSMTIHGFCEAFSDIRAFLICSRDTMTKEERVRILSRREDEARAAGDLKALRAIEHEITCIH